MKKLIYYTELAILVAALYFTHLKLSNLEYIEAGCAMLAVLIYRLISIYRLRQIVKLEGYYKNIIADNEKRLRDEVHRIAEQAPEPTKVETTDWVDFTSNGLADYVAHVPEITDNELTQLRARAVSSKDIAEVLNVHPSTISRRLKKLGI